MRNATHTHPSTVLLPTYLSALAQLARHAHRPFPLLGAIGVDLVVLVAAPVLTIVLLVFDTIMVVVAGRGAVGRHGAVARRRAHRDSAEIATREAGAA